ncbi:MAG: 8-oxoguanine DNA glycosylase [Lachnospiraceae bacterium]|nr:8-oxoguanine DNA glycosylase [Lachnospiraceae bacterium]
MIRKEINEFDLKKTAESGECFRWREKEDGSFDIPAFGRLLNIKYISGNTYELSCSEEDWENIWFYYFDMTTDYEDIGKRIMAGKDDHLKEAYLLGRGIRILRQDLFEIIISFLISQNNNIPRIKKSIEALCKGGKFPYPGEVSDDIFYKKETGLGYRADYLKEMYEYTAAAPEWLEKLKTLSYEEAVSELKSHKGIGPKVADCICLFGLHHIDAFPVDTHIKQLMAKYYKAGFDLEACRGFAGIAQQYLFYYELKAEK